MLLSCEPNKLTDDGYLRPSKKRHPLRLAHVAGDKTRGWLTFVPISHHYAPRAVHTALGSSFFDAVRPAQFPQRTLRFRNQRWAERVGLGELSESEWESHFGWFVPLPQNLERPLALRYHGHQFDQYNPALGDGRGFLFAQLECDGRLLDLGTKGSGTTPWSRGGDGRLTLKGGMREVLATEMLEALGVDTSKSFALFETGEKLSRGDEPSPTRSSVLTRLSHSNLRIGTFQRFAYEENTVALQRLVDHAIEHLFPELANEPDRPAALAREAVRRVARQGAAYGAAGFVHGVLNSDNINITGESFDYGPYRFLPTYDPTFTAAYFDHGGLYCFGRQPIALKKNLQRLCDCLRLLSPNVAWGTIVNGFDACYGEALPEKVVARLGLVPFGADEDALLAETIFTFLRTTKIGFDRFFFDWFSGTASASRALASPHRNAYESGDFAPVRRLLEAFEPRCARVLGTPYFQRESPTTLLYDEIEAIWQPIAARDDWAPFQKLVEEIRTLGSTQGCVGERL
jgi:serine/tyrosine/threonine adenylyltransferase